MNHPLRFLAEDLALFDLFKIAQYDIEFDFNEQFHCICDLIELFDAMHYQKLDDLKLFFNFFQLLF